MTHKKGLHKHGWMLTLTSEEVSQFERAGYKLVTNGAYSKGDYFEVQKPDGSVIKNIDDVYKHFANIKGAINYKKWMEGYYEKIKNKKIWDIAIPGTHNSGIFSSHFTIGARNQTHNIERQLNDGIRFLDLRVCCPDNQYYFIHNIAYAKNALFFDAIDQIRSFLDANKKEIVVIALRTDGDQKVNGLNPDKKVYIHREIKNKLGAYLTPPPKDTDSYGTISELIRANHRAIVISEFWECRNDEFKDYFWPAGDQALVGTYEGYQGAEGYTIKAKYDKLRKSLGSIMAKRTQCTRFYKVDLNLWSINIADSAKNYQHPIANEFLGKKYINSDKSIFIIDFYEMSDFADKVIRLNG